MRASLAENVKTVVYALLIAGLFRTLLFQPFFIPSSSMKETLLIGDFVFVNKFAYGYSKYSCPFSACPFSGRIFGSDPERGDVVVFKHPSSGKDFIKRVVGLPGDRVRLSDGLLYINGKMVRQEPDGVFNEIFERQGGQRSFPDCSNEPKEGEVCTKSRRTELLPNGVSYSILDTRQGYGDNTFATVVPPDEFFVLGDNRDNSQDSRYSRNFGGVGTVPADNLVGRADLIVFSAAGKSLFYFWTWRRDRFFKAIS
ncbi:MAG: signal peptidase I [Rhodobacteraceae bacterium]|nr:signal peptidase I [Paracoccaceae bacterium]